MVLDWISMYILYMYLLAEKKSLVKKITPIESMASLLKQGIRPQPQLRLIQLFRWSGEHLQGSVASHPDPMNLLWSPWSPRFLGNSWDQEVPAWTSTMRCIPIWVFHRFPKIDPTSDSGKPHALFLDVNRPWIADGIHLILQIAVISALAASKRTEKYLKPTIDSSRIFNHVVKLVVNNPKITNSGGGIYIYTIPREVSGIGLLH